MFSTIRTPGTGAADRRAAGKQDEFALFYEIPVARPWQKDSEHKAAFKKTLEQLILGDNVGFHASEFE